MVYFTLILDNTTEKDDYSVIMHDSVKEKLFAIEQRDRNSQDRMLSIAGPRPSEEELEEEESVATSAAASANTSQTGKQKKKKVKELPEAMKQKITNDAALAAVGGTVKSWMRQGATIAAPKKVLPISKPRSNNLPNNNSAMLRRERAGARKFQKRITIKDALFVMENRSELKRTDLLYKWWANVK
jgi:hypothetical protein